MSFEWKRHFWKIFLSATGFALLFRMFAIEDFRILSDSMSPALLTGDLVFSSKSHYNVRLPFSNYEIVRFREPLPGEIVAFSLPERPNQTLIKRVIAIGGQTVQIKNRQVFIDEQPVEIEIKSDTSEIESLGEYRYQVLHGDRRSLNFGPIQVPSDSFFVLGDNRSASSDSRNWGPIPYSNLKGRIRLVWLSLNPEGGIRSERIGNWIR